MKKLPVGIQTFRKIIEGEYLYADKTGYIYDLIQGGSYYFLSRPRRFGKSLFLDTMAEVFGGARELFDGLLIDETDYGWERHPVLRIDMTQVDARDSVTFEKELAGMMREKAAAEGVALSGDTPASLFRGLIEALREKHGRNVVVLIDEYDKPIIDHIDEPEKAEANRESLGYFYGILKGQDANLRFVFLTGVSKFTKLSLFSKLNNLEDLTMWEKYAGVCGFTEREFDALFADRIPAYRESRKEAGGRDGSKSDAEIRDLIFRWYDGYTWDGETRVFNPFSLLNFFNNNKYRAYWYATGAPAFLVKAFRERPYEYAQIQETGINELVLDSHNIENAPLVSLLFQTGFLTVKSIEEGPPEEYTIGFPNTEVSESIGQLYLSTVTGAVDPLSVSFIKEARKALDAGEPERLEAPLNGLYASIPYQLHREEEAYYHSIFLAALQFLGFRILGEVSTAEGRVDGVLDRPNGMSYVIEFKYTKADDDADADAIEKLLDDGIAKAFKQIEKRDYAKRYSGSAHTVFKIAIAVAGRGRVRVCTRK
ncbi:MAG: ATP-binding protein [Clostridiales Family XIII bacterium]|jgi:hypothetical protein|nr:ATP-binding protein [Clostridiales Family XIII bacterium]